MGTNVIERKKHFDRTWRNFDDKVFLNPVLTLVIRWDTHPLNEKHI